jgi:hypothetical protein
MLHKLHQCQYRAENDGSTHDNGSTDYYDYD